MADVNLTIQAATPANISAQQGSFLGIADGGISPVKLSTGNPSWDTSGNLTATRFIGPITGAVTGNVTGNVTGDVTGNLTGTASAIPDLIVTTAKISDASVTKAKLGTNEQKQICKAWVSFVGSTGVIRGTAYNISSITRTGTGLYTITYANGLADSNYSAVATGYLSGTIIVALQCYGHATGSVSIFAYGDATGATNGFAADPSIVSLQIFGN